MEVSQRIIKDIEESDRGTDNNCTTQHATFDENNQQFTPDDAKFQQPG